jgi:Flp pilus assembly pilin Flp
MFERISVMFGRLVGTLRREDGQGATEYAMVIAFVIVGLTITLGALGLGIEEFLTDVKEKLEGLIVG